MGMGGRVDCKNGEMEKWLRGAGKVAGRWWIANAREKREGLLESVGATCNGNSFSCAETSIWVKAAVHPAEASSPL